MIYQGDYNNDIIYGSANGHKIKVVTNDNATFLKCTLTVIFNSETWVHEFDPPFFNAVAELYFENYIHSIITQKFKLPTLEKDIPSFYGIDLAAVSMNLKEMEEDTVLDEMNFKFHISLGKQASLPLHHLNNGIIRLLDPENTPFVTEAGILSFSFYSPALPVKLHVDNGTTTNIINLPTTFETVKAPEYAPVLYTLIIPVKNIISPISDELNLRLEFPNRKLKLGAVTILDDGIDHNLIAFQNQFGTVSIIEFIGEFKDTSQVKSDLSKYIDPDQKMHLKSTNLDVSFPFTLNTGYIYSEEYYLMLWNLITSFNSFLATNDLIQLVLNRSAKITPYKTNFFLNNETIKFKKSEHDNIHYRLF